MAMKKTSKTKRLPKFVAADYMLREHPFIIKLERMFRRMISNANDTRSKTLTNKDLTAYNNFLNKSTDAEIRETKKYLKWYKKTGLSTPMTLWSGALTRPSGLPLQTQLPT